MNTQSLRRGFLLPFDDICNISVLALYFVRCEDIQSIKGA